MNYLEEARENFLKKEKDLSLYAQKSMDAKRFKKEKEDIRTPFFHDIDRIIYDLSYTRYLDKTQVFTSCENDHISKRMTHVQMVSKIARTIGRSLSLNEDLIEAIALGHDIGHTPLGHSGEAMLNKLCQEKMGCTFAHNVESVRYYMEIAHQGEGLNLCLQTLDGILMHNGEVLSKRYIKEEKTMTEFLAEYQLGCKDAEQIKHHHPMTLEGCVVRLSDVIGYIGRDIEDAIMIGKFSREEIPVSIKEVLGDNNRDIINTIILDIIKESMGKPYIQFSQKVYEALFALKKFNMERIYSQSMTTEEYNSYEIGMRKLFDQYIEDIQNERKDSLIYTLFLDTQNQEYIQNNSIERKVVDFIAGMTDEFFLAQIKNLK